MALYINTNIASLDAQNNLSTSQMSLQTSLQRLSSGLRINSAKDDAAGLAISTRMTSQIQGLAQASQNANDGISMSQTAEGGMSTIADNLQRMRTLAVQAANGSNSTSDRQSIQAEIAQLQAQINQVATQTQYNGTNLLDGSLSNAQFQVGSNANQNINISIGNLQGSNIGSYQLPSNTVGTMSVATNSAGANSLAVSAESTDGKTLTLGSTTGLQVGQNIAGHGFASGTIITSINSTANTITLSNADSLNPATFAAFNISTVASNASSSGTGDVISVSGNGTSGNVTTTAGQSADQIAAAINASPSISSTGVTATASNTVTLASLGTGAVSLNLYSTSVTSAGIKTQSMVSVSNGTGQNDLAGLASSINAQSGTSGISATFNTTANTITLSNSTGADIAVQNASSTTSTITVTGSGAASAALTGIGTAGDSATVGGQVNFSSPTSYAVTGTSTDVTGVTTTVGSTLNSVSTINVGTVAGANSAIQVIDAALLNINNQQANMGAVQNRFTSVISNLATSGQNLTAARSLIQDTNFAAETANLTRSQILQQAGTAMLAQANSVPNGVMALLK